MRHKKTRFSRKKGKYKWKAKGKDGLSRDGLLRMRTVPKKPDQVTAILVDKNLVPKEKRQEFIKQFKHKKRKITTNRPIESIVQVDQKGSPTHVRTPKGTILTNTTKLGCLSYYSNQFVSQKLNFKNKKPKASFFNSTSYLAVTSSETITKIVSKKITPALLEKTRKEIEKNKGKRCMSQAKAMVEPGVGEKKAGATDYAKATGNFEEVRKFRWEWLHLIAHSFIAKEGQTHLNLVCGSAFANTNMMFVEGEIRYMIEKYPEGFDLEVKGHLIEETHVATKIEYTIKTRDFCIPFTFNPQTNVKPDIVIGEYTHCLVDAMIDAHADDKSKPSSIVLSTPTKPTTIVGSSFITPSAPTKSTPTSSIVTPVKKPKLTSSPSPTLSRSSSLFSTPTASPIFKPGDGATPSGIPPVRLMTPTQLPFLIVTR